MQSTVSFKNAQVSEWKFQEPRKNPKNGLNVYVSTSNTDASNPKIQLTRMRAPFGIQDGMEVTARKNLELSVDADELLPFLEAVNSRCRDWVISNSSKLFKRVDAAMAGAMFRPLASMPENPNYKPLLRVKINTSTSTPTRVFVVQEDSTPTSPMKIRGGSLADIMPGCNVLPIVELGGLWFVSNSCGLTLVATDLLVWPQRGREAWAFIDIPAVQVNTPEPTYLPHEPTLSPREHMAIMTPLMGVGPVKGALEPDNTSGASITSHLEPSNMMEHEEST